MDSDSDDSLPTIDTLLGSQRQSTQHSDAPRRKRRKHNDDIPIVDLRCTFRSSQLSSSSRKPLSRKHSESYHHVDDAPPPPKKRRLRTSPSKLAPAVASQSLAKSRSFLKASSPIELTSSSEEESIAPPSPRALHRPKPISKRSSQKLRVPPPADVIDLCSGTEDDCALTPTGKVIQSQSTAVHTTRNVNEENVIVLLTSGDEAPPSTPNADNPDIPMKGGPVSPKLPRSLSKRSSVQVNVQDGQTEASVSLGKPRPPLPKRSLIRKRLQEQKTESPGSTPPVIDYHAQLDLDTTPPFESSVNDGYPQPLEEPLHIRTVFGPRSKRCIEKTINIRRLGVFDPSKHPLPPLLTPLIFLRLRKNYPVDRHRRHTSESIPHSTATLSTPSTSSPKSSTDHRSPTTSLTTLSSNVPDRTCSPLSKASSRPPETPPGIGCPAPLRPHEPPSGEPTDEIDTQDIVCAQTSDETTAGYLSLVVETSNHDEGSGSSPTQPLVNIIAPMGALSAVNDGAPDSCDDINEILGILFPDSRCEPGITDDELMGLELQYPDP